MKMNRLLFTSVLLALACAVTCPAAKKSTISVNVVFSDGTKALWPCAEKKPSNSIRTATGMNEEVSYTIKEGGYQFTLKTLRGHAINSKYGLCICTDSGDRVSLPAIEGMSMTNISIKTGEGSKILGITLSDVNGTAISGGEAPEKVNDALEWKLSNAPKGQPVCMNFSGKGLLQIKEITMQYEGVAPKVKKVKAPKSKSKVIEVNFRTEDGTAAYWPFDGKSPSSSRPVSEADFVTEKLEEFSVKCSDKVYNNSKSGLTMGSQPYSYLMLPSYKTKALTKIVMVSGGSGSMGKPAIMHQNSWKKVQGGDSFPTYKRDAEYEWNLVDAEPGERCRIVLTAEGNIAIKKLTLYYE